MLRDQRQRDARDAARAIAPMKPADDAIVIDSTGLSIEEVVRSHGGRYRGAVEGRPASEREHAT